MSKRKLHKLCCYIDTISHIVFYTMQNEPVFMDFSVKPVNKGDSKETQHMVFIDKWSLFGG